MALSGILLAGGRSRRMGTDKALLEHEGRTLAERAAAVLVEACDDVVVASGDGRRLALLGLPQVPDAAAGAGPLSGLVAGLAATRHPLAAVLAVDLVDASAAVLRALAARWSGEGAVVPVVHGRPQPLHALWARDALPELRRRLEAGQLGVVDAARAVGAMLAGPDVWSAADASGAFARNVNSPADL